MVAQKVTIIRPGWGNNEGLSIGKKTCAECSRGGVNNNFSSLAWLIIKFFVSSPIHHNTNC